MAIEFQQQCARVLVIPICLLLFVGCSWMGAESRVLPGEPVSFSVLQSTATIDFEVVDRGWWPQGEEDPVHHLFRDAETFEAFWISIYGDHEGAEPVPEVDFSETSVFALLIGARPSTAYSIHVTEVTRADGVLHVGAEERTPGNCFGGDAITFPYIIVAVDAVAEDVIVQKEERPLRC